MLIIFLIIIEQRTHGILQSKLELPQKVLLSLLSPLHQIHSLLNLNPLVQLIKLFKIETSGSSKTARPNNASDDYRYVEPLGNPGFLHELRELADDEEGPQEGDEEEETQAEEGEDRQWDGGHA